jgi:hypothetical protein
LVAEEKLVVNGVQQKPAIVEGQRKGCTCKHRAGQAREGASERGKGERTSERGQAREGKQGRASERGQAREDKREREKASERERKQAREGKRGRASERG